MGAGHCAPGNISTGLMKQPNECLQWVHCEQREAVLLLAPQRSVSFTLLMNLIPFLLLEPSGIQSFLLLSSPAPANSGWEKTPTFEAGIPDRNTEQDHLSSQYLEIIC